MPRFWCCQHAFASSSSWSSSSSSWSFSSWSSSSSSAKLILKSIFHLAVSDPHPSSGPLACTWHRVYLTVSLLPVRLCHQSHMSFAPLLLCSSSFLLLSGVFVYWCALLQLRFVPHFRQINSIRAGMEFVICTLFVIVADRRRKREGGALSPSGSCTAQIRYHTIRSDSNRMEWNSIESNRSGR